MNRMLSCLFAAMLCGICQLGAAKDALVVTPKPASGMPTCPKNYVLIVDVCAHKSGLQDTNALVEAIMIHRGQVLAISKPRENASTASNIYGERVVPIPSSGYIYSKDGGYVACTMDYGSYKDATRNTCAGGAYGSYHDHGSFTACGGQYGSYHDNGGNTCTGGRYDSYHDNGGNTSAGGRYNSYHDNGSTTACGGEYSSWHSNSEAVCAGGRYDSWRKSYSDIACGGEYDGWQDSDDGKKVCVGGRFNGCVHSKDGRHVACGRWRTLD